MPKPKPMNNSKDFLLNTIKPAPEKRPAKWWCIVIEQGENGELIASQDGVIVPDGAIAPNDNAIFINESGADPERIAAAKQRLYK